MSGDFEHSGTGSSGGSPVTLAVGERLGGRYLIQSFLGEGGMGAVYRALDEQLGEDIALKVVRTTAVDTLRDEVRLAQKVTHPNVCRTYDLEVIDGQHLVKMEYVEGETLAVRLERDRRLPIGEALRIARAIAEGLAAAHDKGIVHRDLKPGNVMLAGDRVVLMDFGIASLIASPVADVAGTLGYMAPEQIKKGDVDGRADYYALGCLLYEMLTGEHVFTGDPVLITAQHGWSVAPSVRDKRRETPRWLARAVKLLLAKEPAERPAGVALLRRGPRRTLLPITMVALVAVAVAAVVFATRSTVVPCQGIDRRLAGIWDPVTKQKIRAGFDATKRPYARSAFAVLERSLDRYTGDWVATSVESCRATRVRGDQTEAVLSLRQTCLDERLEDLRALTVLLADPHPLLIDKADRIASELQPLSLCSNVAALRAPDQPTPAQRAKVDAIGKQLTEARANVIAGRFLPALVAGQKAVDDTRAIGFAPIEAEALYVRATALTASGNARDAALAYEQAVWTAMRARRDDLATGAALAMAVVTAETLGKPGEAKVWIRLAIASAERGGVEHVYEPNRYMVEGIVMALAGDARAAVVAHGKMFEVYARLLGRDNAELWAHESMFATSLVKAQSYARAAPHLEHAIKLRQQAVGEDHSDVAVLLSNLGIAYRNVGEFAKARAAFERSIAIREKLFGKHTPVVVPALVNFASFLSENEKDHAGALAVLERALPLAQQYFGEEHPNYHETATAHFEVLYRLGRIAEARKRSNDVLALEKRTSSPTLPVSHSARAELELAQRDYKEAASHASAAIAAFEQLGGADNVELWRPLTRLAQAQLGLGDRAAAKSLLERAVAIGERAQIGEHLLGETRGLLRSM